MAPFVLVDGEIMGFWIKKDIQTTAQATSVPGEQNMKSGEHVAVSSKPSGFFEARATSTDAVLDRFGKVRSALGSGTVIQGKLTFDTPVRIDGSLSGEVFSTNTLIIGPGGSVDATVEVASLIVCGGSVKGTVQVSERVELYSGAKLDASVTTPVFVVEKGCRFNGECKMPQKERAKVIAASVEPAVQKASTPDMSRVSQKASENHKRATQAGR